MKKSHVMRWAMPEREHQRETRPAADSRVTVRMIAFPEVRSLEDKYLLYSSARGGTSPDVQKLSEVVTEAIFGATWADTQFQLPDEFWLLPEGCEERERLDDLWWEHESQFETDGMSESEAVEYLRALGLDFTDEHQRPLRCLGAMCRVAEAAAKGIVGTVPTPDGADLAWWENRMTEEATKFLRGRKG